MHVISIDPTLIHIVERYVVCTYIQVKTFLFAKAFSYLSKHHVFPVSTTYTESKIDEKEVGRI